MAPAPPIISRAARFAMHREPGKIVVIVEYCRPQRLSWEKNLPA